MSDISFDLGDEVSKKKSFVCLGINENIFFQSTDNESTLDYSSAAIDSFIAESRALLLEAGIDISDAERLVTTADANETIDLINLTDDDNVRRNNVPRSSAEIICIDDSIYMPPARQTVSRIRNNEVIDLCSPSSPKRSRINSDRKPIDFNMPAPTPVPKPVEAPPQNVCPVCLDDYKKNNPTTTTCGHIFCGPCISKCVQNYHKCPNCNKKLNMKQLIKIYI